MALETTGNGYSNDRRVGYYRDIKEHQLLGFNLAVSDGEDPRLAACAPLWKNNHNQNRGHYATQGLCYEMVGDEVHMRRPLIEATLQSRNDNYFYVYGQAGFSATYAKGKDNDKLKLVGGAPSMNNNKGGFVAFDVDVPYIKTTFSSPREFVIIGPKATAKGWRLASGYTGYSIASGNIFGPSRVSYVIGVPKSHPNGGVAIIDNNKYKLLQFITGEQFGSYFGASVCTMDFNGDGFDDVIVGAPIFSKRNKENAGKVYVFLTKKTKRQVRPELSKLFDVTLHGSGDSKAMFGLALADIGDINRDGTSDLAVGAPYEDDWRGAVYIYNGGRWGNSVHSQKIKGRSLHRDMRTFGWSLSNGRDMDNNGYPDFAVGSYFSDQAVLLRSRPVVQIDAELRVTPPQINPKSPGQINVTLCLTYSGHDLPQSIGVNYTLHSDTTRRSVGKFIRAKFQETMSVKFSATAAVARGIKSCQDVPVQVNPDRELLSHIEFQAEIELANVKGNASGSPSEILDPLQDTHLFTKAAFQNKCGDDNRCITDLRIAFNGTKFEGSDQLIIGQTTAVWIQMIIENLGEEAYMAVMTVTIPERVEYAGLNSRTNKRVTCATVSSLAQSNNRLVHCDLGNPIDEHSQIVLDMKLDVSKSIEDVYVHAVVTSTSFENNSTLSDNMVSSSLVASLDVSLVVDGQSHPEQMSLSVEREDNELLNFTHTLQLENTGPSRLPAAEIIILLPESDKRETTVFVKRTDIKVTMWQDSSMESDLVACRIDDESVLSSGELVGAESDAFQRPMTTEPLTKSTPEKQESIKNRVTNASSHETETVMRRKKRAAGKKKLHSAPSGHVLDCGTVPCIPVRCMVERLDVGQRAHVNLSLSISEAALGKLKSRSSVLYQTTVSVHPQGGLGFPSLINDDPAMHSINTTFHRSAPPHEEVALWVIIVSAVGAALLLLLIGFILYKCGFFGRNKHKKVEDWKRKSGYSHRSTPASQRSSSISHVTGSPNATGQPSVNKNPTATDAD